MCHQAKHFLPPIRFSGIAVGRELMPTEDDPGEQAQEMVDRLLLEASARLEAAMSNLAAAIENLWDTVEAGGSYAVEFIHTATSLSRLHQEMSETKASIDASVAESSQFWVRKTP